MYLFFSVQQSVGIDNHMDEEALQEQSQFFSYFVLFTILCIVAYCMYFNKKKVIFGGRMLFQIVPGGFSFLIDQIDQNSNWKKNIWIQKHSGKVRENLQILLLFDEHSDQKFKIFIRKLLQKNENHFRMWRRWNALLVSQKFQTPSPL